MGIGTSLGAFFETDFDHHTGNELNMDAKDNNELSPNEIMPQHDDVPKITSVDYKTASPLVTITDEDIDKGVGVGLSFSGGGLSTIRRGLQLRSPANDNVKDLNNPNLSKVDQLAKKLGEAENGKGSWGRIGGGGQEHYYRDARRALRNDPSANDVPGSYNPREPNMIGSKTMDDGMDKAWSRMIRGNEIIEQRGSLMDTLKDRPLNDIEKQKLKNLDKQHEEHFGGYRPD